MSARNSIQRQWIYEYIQNHKEHLTADEIYDGLKKSGKNVSVATVYRNLKILVDEFKITTITTDNKKQVYDKTCKPHDHFICNECHSIYDLDAPYDRSIESKYAKQLGLSIEAHELTLYGLCHDCHLKKDEGKKHGIKRI